MTSAGGDEASTAGQAAGPFDGPASWQLDAQGSSVALSHKTLWGLATVRGTFSELSGSAEILADGSARGRLAIEATSIDTKNAKRDKHLRSADFFGAETHPQIVAELNHVTRKDGESTAVDGTLAVAGTTRPLNFAAKITEATDQAITLRADAEINRADFGSSWNQLGMIKGNAQVHVVARFTRPAATPAG
jgi:polyisoprenoid-binding protein YceI